MLGTILGTRDVGPTILDLHFGEKNEMPNISSETSKWDNFIDTCYEVITWGNGIESDAGRVGGQGKLYCRMASGWGSSDLEEPSHTNVLATASILCSIAWLFEVNCWDRIGSSDGRSGRLRTAIIWRRYLYWPTSKRMCCETFSLPVPQQEFPATWMNSWYSECPWWALSHTSRSSALCFKHLVLLH